MSIVMHKYSPEQIPEHELLATFAAREHTLEFLLSAVRQQTRAGTLCSYLITGPRGAGKTALLRMLGIRIREDAELHKAWLIVTFPEEQFNVASLRDLLAATLKTLAGKGIQPAADWLARVEAEADEDQSEQLAITALKQIAAKQGRRFTLILENLEEFFERTIDDRMKATLRRLLMTDPFMFIVGSAVHVFESLRQYDEAFFNYFCRVRLPRLDETEVYELLRKRAEFDRNDSFLRDFRILRPKIRALAHLSGGNPRLILMLYELLSQREVTTIVQELCRLVDELTPLLKHELENLPPQQQKIVHALIEEGGTATPAALASLTRISLNAVTAQLRRLKEAQILELRGGGKGRPAYYTVPDKLFSIWYQMRYLRQRRRQIEMFVEILRIWFEAEERLRILHAVVAGADSAPPNIIRETAGTAEYFAASLASTPYEEVAHDLALRQWLIASDVHEAAMAHAELARIHAPDEVTFETRAYAGLGRWCLKHNDPKTALPALELAAQRSDDPEILMDYGIALGNDSLAAQVFDRIVGMRPSAPGLLADALFNRGVTKVQMGDLAGAITDYTDTIQLAGVPTVTMVRAMVNRGAARLQQGDMAGAILDCTTVIQKFGAPIDQVAGALLNRGNAKSQRGDTSGAISDHTSAIALSGTPVGTVAGALVNRGIDKRKQGDLSGAIADYSDAIDLPGAPADMVARARVGRGNIWREQGDSESAIVDFTAAIELSGAQAGQVATTLVSRGVARSEMGDMAGAISDYTSAIELPSAPAAMVASALFNRGFLKNKQGDKGGALSDYNRAIELPGAPAYEVTRALINRGVVRRKQGDLSAAIADYSAAIVVAGAPTDLVATALLYRGGAKLQQGDLAGAITDYNAAIELPSAPMEFVVRALRDRGVARSRRGEVEGAIADYTAAIEFADAPSDIVAEALVNRGLAKQEQGDAVGATADFTGAIELLGAPTNVRLHAARIAFRVCWFRGWRDRCEEVLAKLIHSFGSKNPRVTTESLIHWLAALAEPDLKDAWPAACRYLIQHQPGEVAEALDLFRPVCEVLETGDRSLLDPLPPERREFVEQVLERFVLRK